METAGGRGPGHSPPRAPRGPHPLQQLSTKGQESRGWGEQGKGYFKGPSKVQTRSGWGAHPSLLCSDPEVCSSLPLGVKRLTHSARGRGRLPLISNPRHVAPIPSPLGLQSEGAQTSSGQLASPL